MRRRHDQFLKEASTLARLDHPNLPKVSDYFSQDGREYLVMDYVPGDDLQTILRASREKDELLDEATVLSWAEQIIDAMAYLACAGPTGTASRHQAVQYQADAG